MANSIKEVILKMQKQNYERVKVAISNQAIYGTVTQVKDSEDNPLIEIKIEDNLVAREKLNLIISPVCRPPVTSDDIQVGDKILLLSLNDGSLFYAMQKV